MPKPVKNAPPVVSRPVPETVDPVWLLKAAGLVLVAAMVCGYLAICGLFWKGQWQLVLHPLHAERHQPAEFGLTGEEVSFGADASGTPQLRGWWFAGEQGAPAVVMLPDGDGSAGDLMVRARTFHDARLNVLLFDYRGAGRSLGAHPTERTMREDTESALAFAASRGAAANATVVYGAGAGASLAVWIADKHASLAAVVLENADGDFETRARKDARAAVVPFTMLFHEKFALADPLAALKTPKLLMSSTGGHAPAIYERAGSPKMMLEIPVGAPASVTEAGVRRFLGMYVSLPPATLVP